MRLTSRNWLGLVSCMVFAGCSCESVTTIGGDAGAPNDGGADAGSGLFQDFPPAPILDNGGPSAVPPSAPNLFSDAGTVANSGPCVIEPQAGTLFPQNWLRPRITFVPLPGENLFEIRFHAPGEANDLLVYTTATQSIMPSSIWSSLAQHIVSQPINVMVRGAVYSNGQLTRGPEVGQSAPFTIAPVGASGSIVFWTIYGTNSTALQGFTAGEETIHTVMTPTEAGTQCVACHSSTPDGLFVGFSAAPITDGTQASVNALSIDGGAPLPFITTAAQSLLNRIQQELPRFSAAHWSPGDRVAVSMFPVSGRYEAIWTDLEATAADQGVGWGVLSRTGDTGMADYASFDHTGQRVLYVSTSTNAGGVIANDGIVRTIPWGNRDGGVSTPVHGADDPNYNQFYPVFSPDDQLVAFNRVPGNLGDGGDTSYNNPRAEVYVVPVGAPAGTQPTRLDANDPPACLGVSSPGLTNSWPRWAPTATLANDGRTYYWLTFSSNATGPQRQQGGGSPQLFVTAVVVDSSANGGSIQTYPALYLWNQPATQHNHTPVWDTFQIGLQ